MSAAADEHDDDDDDAPGAAGEGQAAGWEPPRGDPFGPPAEPCECWCLHCRRTFMSDGIWFQRVVNDPDGFAGFWMCPTPNCDGKGFTFDIYPTDPDHPANEGWSYDDDGEDEDTDDEGALEEDEPFDEVGDEDDNDAAGWDPDEAKYKEIEAALGDAADDDDLEGEEWKFGLAPGERPPGRGPANWSEEDRAEWEAEQRSYDEPDRRPREVDHRDHPSRRQPPGGMTEDDIPF